jgi:uncharacterized DUF497 family protein
VITFDPAKSERNRALRGLSFEMAAGFAFDTAVIRRDRRFDYPEPRFQAVGLIGEEICFLVFTPLPLGFRVISLRKASRKERRTWLASQTQD